MINMEGYPSSFYIKSKKILKILLTYYNYCSIIVVELRKGAIMNDKALNIKIPSKLYEQLKTEAERKNVSLASIVRIICSEYFDNK